MDDINTRIDPKSKNELSILGFGCMRFPTSGQLIDETKSREMLLYAVSNGVNYFDTAYIYHFGQSEKFLGKFISQENLRSKVYIATKLPHYLVKSADDIEKIFKKQTSRLQTDYIDYYLMHMLGDIENWNRLCSFGIERWIQVKKEEGQIKNIGFSFHGHRDQFKNILNSYNWDFAQIQYNYLDENNQAGITGLMAAHDKGMGVIIMEPLRGGRLVNQLPPEVEELWRGTGKSAAEQALNWVWNHSEVTLLLSGMNTMQQVKQNIRFASQALPGMLTQEELALFQKARAIINEKGRVPCTGCGYCMPCPHGVDIPTCFSCYNGFFNFNTKMWKYVQATGAFTKSPAYASLCVKCGKCEKHCPQNIPIRERLKDVSNTLEKFPFKQVTGIARKFLS